MDYIKNTFARMDLQQIRQFLLYEVEEMEIDNRPYKDRIKFGCDPIYNRLNSTYHDQSERDKAAADLSQALSTYESVYMELGMKAGARLIYQLLLTDDQLPTDGDNKGGGTNG